MSKVTNINKSKRRKFSVFKDFIATSILNGYRKFTADEVYLLPIENQRELVRSYILNYMATVTEVSGHFMSNEGAENFLKILAEKPKD